MNTEKSSFMRRLAKSGNLADQRRRVTGEGYANSPKNCFHILGDFHGRVPPLTPSISDPAAITDQHGNKA
jgi:hypothetical protein